MNVTISVAMLAGVTVFLLCKYGGMRMWHAAVSMIFGFFLASTSFAPYITQFTSSMLRK